jgi:PPOX class probable F420-dependent enzyme
MPVTAKSRQRRYLAPMALLDEHARAAIEAGHLGHLVTLNPDGSPQVSLVWIGLDGDDIVIGHLGAGRKIDNIRRDPRVVLSVETDERNPMGLDHYLVVHAEARIVPGGAPALLQRLAHTYLGPDVRFPPFDNPPEGNVIHLTPTRIGGVGPWAATD